MNDSDIPTLFTWRTAAFLVVSALALVALYTTYAYIEKAKNEPFRPPEKPKVWIK